MPAPLELADILRRHGPSYRQLHADSLGREPQRVMRAIEQCRTAALGGHVEQCDSCGHQRIAYNSCRNRHCPKCQSLARAQWLDDRQADLLPVPYFHVVFTVPEPIAAIAFQNKRVVYDILLQATADTLRTVDADSRHLGATLGFIAILHTWGQTLVTASSPAGVSRWTVSAGSPADPGSSCPSGCSRAYSGDCFSRACNMPPTPEGCDSSQR